jgi:hypothetical protein
MAKRTPVNKARVMESAMRGREEFFIAVHPCIWVRIFRARPAGHFPNARKRIPEAASFYDSGVVAGSMDAGSSSGRGFGRDGSCGESTRDEVNTKKEGRTLRSGAARREK